MLSSLLMSLGQGWSFHLVISDKGTPSVRYAIYFRPDRFVQLLSLKPILILLLYQLFHSLNRSIDIVDSRG